MACISGVRTEWDFVEAPSQMLEEWCWDASVLSGFARHHQSGAPLPADLVARMRAADEFGKGLRVRQQMYYAAVSLAFHGEDPRSLDTTALMARLQERLTPFRYVPETYFHESFGHLEGYSAIYYTYMWSLVIAKDLFGAFRREGLMNAATAIRYRKSVLEPGGEAQGGGEKEAQAGGQRGRDGQGAPQAGHAALLEEVPGHVAGREQGRPDLDQRVVHLEREGLAPRRCKARRRDRRGACPAEQRDGPRARGGTDLREGDPDEGSGEGDHGRHVARTDHPAAAPEGVRDLEDDV